MTRALIERLYSQSGGMNEKGQYGYYGKVGGCLVTGYEDGIKHVAMSLLYALQHVGYTIPAQADAGWIGEAGPGPSYLDEGSGGPQNDFTQRNTTFMSWNLMHLAVLLKREGGLPATGIRAASGMRVPVSITPIRNTARAGGAVVPAASKVECEAC